MKPRATQRYPSMLRSLPRGATRAQLEAELARLEVLEADPSWRGVTDADKGTVRQRVDHLDRHGRDTEREIPRATAVRRTP